MFIYTDICRMFKGYTCVFVTDKTFFLSIICYRINVTIRFLIEVNNFLNRSVWRT